MEIVGVLRALVRHRALLATGIVVALVLGVLSFIELSSSQRDLNVSTARVLIDARTTPSTDLESSVADTLGLRAGIVADLMSTRGARAEIARAAGVDVDELAVFGPSMDAPALLLPLAVAATEAAAEVREPYLVRVSARGRIPFLQITASAPTAAEAMDLVDATRTSLGTLVARRSSRGPGLQVKALGPSVTKTTRDSPPRALAAFVTVGVLGTWCAAIVVVAGLLGAWRRRSSGDRAGRAAI